MASKEKSKPKKLHDDLEAFGVRIEPQSLRALEKIAENDPERATVATLIRRAIREYLQRQGVS